MFPAREWARIRRSTRTGKLAMRLASAGAGETGTTFSRFPYHFCGWMRHTRRLPYSRLRKPSSPHLSSGSGHKPARFRARRLPMRSGPRRDSGVRCVSWPRSPIRSHPPRTACFRTEGICTLPQRQFAASAGGRRPPLRELVGATSARHRPGASSRHSYSRESARLRSVAARKKPPHAPDLWTL